MRPPLFALVFLVFSTAFAENSKALDHDFFNELCLETTSSEENFKYFRKSQFCTQIVDTVWQNLGGEFAYILLNEYPDLLDHLEEFRKNDSVGNPETLFFPNLGHFCPSTVRYITLAAHLRSLFGDLSGKTVVEIGVGYGGQCRILSSLFSMKEYIIVDYPAVLELSKKYLEALNVKNVRYLTPDQVSSDIVSDLVISNYAFSECFEAARINYIDKIFNHSQCGYMICNDPIEYGLSIMDRHFDNKKATLQTQPENPQTGNNNYLLIWK